MNKNTTKLSVSVLPVIVLIVVIVIIYFLFFSNTDLINLKKSPEVRRLNGFPTELITDKKLEKKRLVIKNEEELAEFLNYIDDSGYLIVRDEINFDKEYLLAISTKSLDTTGHALKIRKLYENKETNTLLVSVRETEPGANCEIEEKPSVAVDVVAISHTIMNIDFDRVKQIVECD